LCLGVATYHIFLLIYKNLIQISLELRTFSI